MKMKVTSIFWYPKMFPKAFFIQVVKLMTVFKPFNIQQNFGHDQTETICK